MTKIYHSGPLSNKSCCSTEWTTKNTCSLCGSRTLKVILWKERLLKVTTELAETCVNLHYLISYQNALKLIRNHFDKHETCKSVTSLRFKHLSNNLKLSVQTSSLKSKRYCAVFLLISLLVDRWKFWHYWKLETNIFPFPINWKNIFIAVIDTPY